MTALAVFSLCHPKRRAIRDGKCRECCQVGRAESPDDLWPAIIANTVQHAGPVAPSACPKCGGWWAGHEGYLGCVNCGSTFHRTSTRVLARPKNTPLQVIAAWRALRWRRDRT